MWTNLHSVISAVMLLGCIEGQLHPKQRPDLPNFTKYLNYAGYDLVLSYEISSGVSFVHATCRRHHDYEYYKGSQRAYKICRLFVETTTPMGKSNTQSCEIRLYPKYTGGAVARQFKLVRFTYDYVILVWRENIDISQKKRLRRYIPYPVIFTYRKDYLYVEVVKMEGCKSKNHPVTSEQRDKIYEPKICGVTLGNNKSHEECRKNQTEIFVEEEGKIHNVNIVVNHEAETFDVFYRDADACGREKRCKITYDSGTGQFSSYAVAALEVKYDASLEVQPIVSVREPSNVLAYAVRSLYLDDGAVTLVDPSSGRQIFEHTYSWSSYNLRKGISTMAMSTLEETLGICQQPTTEPVIQCSLFDTRGKGLMGVDIALKSSDVAVIEMRNTFDGGFLLLVGYGNATTKNGLDALDILRVDSKGELANVHSAKSHRCHLDESGVDVGLIERSATQVCYYMACIWPMPTANVAESRWQLFGDCFIEN